MGSGPEELESGLTSEKTGQNRAGEQHHRGKDNSVLCTKHIT